MKVCKYCNTVNEDSALRCRSCGASDFKYKCGSCGAVYETGRSCPMCGARAAAGSKLCPKCHTRYFFGSCPNCGYTQPKPPHLGWEKITMQQKSGRLWLWLWLWILGFLFFFPIPLTILIMRSPRLGAGSRAALLVGLWLLVLLFIIIN